MSVPRVLRHVITFGTIMQKARTALLTHHTTHIPVHNSFVSCVRNNEPASWNVHSHFSPCYCFHMIHCVRSDERCVCTRGTIQTCAKMA